MTAQQAYELALAVHQDQVNESVNEILKKIEEQAEKGKFYLDYTDILFLETKNQLEELGYKVTQFSEKIFNDRLGYPGETKYFKISWYKNNDENSEEEDGGIAG